MLTPKHQKGVLNEQRAILYLMKKGFTVFQAESVKKGVIIANSQKLNFGVVDLRLNDGN